MTDFLYPDILNEQLTYARQARAAWLLDQCCRTKPDFSASSGYPSAHLRIPCP